MTQSTKHGFTLFMTGLSGAGKSTVADALVPAIENGFQRPVTVLDGDIVRTMLSSGLSFSRADRELNIRRIAYVAGEVTRHGGICICAAIAPHRNARDAARSYIKAIGGFYEIYVSTPLAVCEARDVKGLYAKARRGEIKGFTGIDDPFEAPVSPDLALDTSQNTLEQSVEKILSLPRRDGLL